MRSKTVLPRFDDRQSKNGAFLRFFGLTGFAAPARYARLTRAGVSRFCQPPALLPAVGSGLWPAKGHFAPGAVTLPRPLFIRLHQQELLHFLHFLGKNDG
ncbi:MAG: hypothetical protein ABF335_01485 [Alphaproteobacteria bacterium]